MPALNATKTRDPWRSSQQILAQPKTQSQVFQQITRTNQPKPSTEKEDEQVDAEDEDFHNETRSGSDMDIDDAFEKDEAEKELERLVFGDRDGFRSGLHDFNEGLDTFNTDERADGVPSRLEGLTDAELFFTDINPEEGIQLPLAASHGATEDDKEQSILPRAWEDSDDERLQISLAGAPRLRKLRRSEAEDVVSGTEYSQRLRQQFRLLNPTPKWAEDAIQRPARKKRRYSQDGSGQDDEASADEMDTEDTASVAPLATLLQDANSLIRETRPGVGKKRKLRPEMLEIQRQKDIPGVQPSAITSLSFHPSLPLLLSSGPASTLYLHQISPSPPAPTPNPLLTSMHVRGSQLTTTAFHPFDSRIFLSARRRYFHVWNLSTGRVEKITRVYGQQHEQQSMERFLLSPDGCYMALLGSSRKGGGVVNVLDAGTLQWVAQARIESRHGIADFAWWRNSQGLCIAGKNGEVTEWSLRDQRTVARWQDEGAVGTTVIALGGQHDMHKGPIGSDRWIAIGSSSGIVNIYDRRVWLTPDPKTADIQHGIPPAPKPTKTFDHLTTSISHLAFAPDAQIMVMASRWKRDALRMVHLPSCTVFQNWPTSATPLGRISSVAWARGDVLPEGSDVHCLLAVANEQGKIRLWEVR